jgi:hypothetical protein
MNIKEIISQRDACKNQFHLSDEQFDLLIEYLENNDLPKYNTAVVVKLDDKINFDKDNTIHVSQFFYDALKHARNVSK